jgi:MtfA peptidase
MIFSWLKSRRRRQILAEPFPDAWLEVLQRDVAYYGYLEPQQQAALREIVQVFVAEKNWEGCGGLVLTDEIKVTIAALAAILLLGMPHDYFSSVLSVLVYPAAFATHKRQQVGGLELDGPSDHLGEAWYRGPVILSWDEILDAAQDPHSGRNLVWHEFAHQLDMLDRSADGTPPLATREQAERWQKVMTAEFNELRRDAQHGRPALLDYYGATNEAEFFAVATECFFDLPGPMKQAHPEMFALLAEYYGQDPTQWVPELE